MKELTNRARSPPARGWPAGAAAHSRGDRAFPARAGMARMRAAHDGLFRRVPRPRGDGPAHARQLGLEDSRSPPARGWPVRVLHPDAPYLAPPPPPRGGRTRYNPPFPFPVGVNGRSVAVRRYLPHPSAVASVRGLRAESGRDRRMARLVRRAAARRPRAPRPPELLRAAHLADAASLRPPARSGPRAGAGQA